MSADILSCWSHGQLIGLALCWAIYGFLSGLLMGWAVWKDHTCETTRFSDFDDVGHPFRIWWEEHGQFMLSGGGRRESIWAARGWIAREQMAQGQPVTGDSMHEEKIDGKQPRN